MTGGSYGVAFPAAGRAAWRVDSRPNYEGGDGAVVFEFRKGFPAALPDPGLTTGRTMFDANGKLVYSRENLWQYSERLGTSPWVIQPGASMDEAAIANPLDGAMTGNAFTSGNVLFGALIRQGVTGIAGVPMGATVYAKKNNHRYLGFRLPNNTATDAAGNIYTFFDFDTETWTEEESAGPVTTKTEVLSDGWYRLGVFSTISTRTANTSCDIAPCESDGNVDFTPAGTEKVYLYGAMCYRGDGFIPYIATTNASVHKPRTGAHYYDGAAWRNGGILIEEAQTELLLHNRQFDNAAWPTGSTTPVLSQDQVGSEGVANTAWTCEDNDTGSQERFEQSVTVTDAAEDYTAWVRILIDNDETRFPELHFTLSGGTIQQVGIGCNTKSGAHAVRFTTGSPIYTVHVITEGVWRKFAVTMANNSSGNTTAVLRIAPAAESVLGTADNAATGSIVLDRCSIQKGSRPLSDIPTAAATVTRTGDDIPDIPETWWRGEAQTIVDEFVPLLPNGTGPVSSSENRKLSMLQRTGSPSHQSEVTINNTTGTCRLQASGTGGTPADVSTGNAVTPDQTNKLASTWDDNAGKARICLNAGTVAEDATFGRSDVGPLNSSSFIGKANVTEAFPQHLNGFLTKRRITAVASSAAELQALTS